MADDRRRQQAWRSGGARPAHEPGPRKRGQGKRLVVLALILGVVGAIAGMFYYMQPLPEPLFRGVAIAQYEERSYAPNPWAFQDADGIRVHFPEGSEKAVSAQAKDALIDLVKEAADRTDSSKDRNRPVVVYLNAHAITRGGKVHVLPIGAKPTDVTTWLPLQEIIDALRRGRGERLMLLDLARPIADAHAGLLADDVSAAIHQELARDGALGNMLVLTACGDGQLAHAAPELQRSLFGFFIDQGLRGHADTWADGNKDDRVSARELVEYVRGQVAHWTNGNQTPTIYGRGGDFILLTPKDKPAPITAPEELPEYPPWLLAGWKERDLWWAKEAFRYVPRTYSELEVLLLSSERRWLAGVNPELIEADFKTKFDDLKAQRAGFEPKPQTARSLAEVGTKLNDDAVRLAVRPLLEKIRRDGALKPDDKDLAKFAEKPPDVAPFAALIHQTLVAVGETEPTPELLKEYGGFVNRFTPAPAFFEFATLKFLIELHPNSQKQWDEPQLAGVRTLVLRVARGAEEAVAVDPRVRPWIEAELVAADTDHREGLLQLATLGFMGRKQGKDRLTAAAETYKTIADDAKTLKHGFERLEEAYVLLPALAVAFAERPAKNADADMWKALIDGTRKLQSLLVPPKSPGKLPDGVKSLADSLRDRLYDARVMFQTNVLNRQLKLIGKDGGPTADDLRRLLASPLWSAPDRQRIYNEARDLGKKTTALSIDKAMKLTRGDQPPTARKAADAPAWRAQLALDLLRLDASFDMAPLDGLLGKAKKDGGAMWHELGNDLRKAWAVDLPEKFRTLSDAAARERVGYVLHPFDQSALDATGGVTPEPTPELRRAGQQQFWQWLAGARYQAMAEKLIAKHPDRTDLSGYSRAYEEARQDLLLRRP